jgi:hypothetical protein
LFAINDVHKNCPVILISGIATTRDNLRKLISCSLLSVQASRLNVNLLLEIDKILTQLIKLQALCMADPEQSR